MLNEQALRNIGFNDPNVIAYILGNPNERSRYERELGVAPSYVDVSGNFSFDYANETERAYDDLGSYYDELLNLAEEDVNLAIARLQEDYETGNRFQGKRGELSRELLDIARADLAQNAESAKRTLEKNFVSRGILRSNPADPTGNMGIATAESQRLQENVNQAERRQSIGEQQFNLGEEQDTLLRNTALSRGKEDISREDTRYRKSLEEERKERAGTLAASRAQRAYNRFEGELI